jgi:hypothetical protein
VAANKRGAATNESDAYRAQSYTSEAGHSNNTSGVWNESWANGPDKEVLRTAAIKEAAGRSEAATKTYEDKQKK